MCEVGDRTSEYVQWIQWWGNCPLFSQHLERLESINQGAISLNVQGLTCQCRLYRVPHRGKDQGVQNLKFFHRIPPQWNLLHTVAGSYWCYQLINSGRLVHSKGVSIPPLFHEVPNLPRDSKGYRVSILQQESWGSELTYLWQASEKNECYLRAENQEVALTQPFILEELIKLLRAAMVHCQVSLIYISYPLQGEQ